MVIRKAKYALNAFFQGAFSQTEFLECNLL
jgi:hypothetical protein